MESTCLHSEKAIEVRREPPAGHIGPWLTQILRWSNYPHRHGAKWDFRFEWIGPGKPADPAWEAGLFHGPCEPGARLVSSSGVPDGNLIHLDKWMLEADEAGCIVHIAGGKPQCEGPLAILRIVLPAGRMEMGLGLVHGGRSCGWEGVLAV